MTNNTQVNEAQPKTFPSWYRGFSILLAMITITVIVNISIDYRLGPLESKIQQLEKRAINGQRIKVLDTKEMATFFTKNGYDTLTEMEYMDILKILLKESNIIAVKPETLQIDTEGSDIVFHPIETLRERLEVMGLENPRVTNKSRYENREKIYNELMEQLL